MPVECVGSCLDEDEEPPGCEWSCGGLGGGCGERAVVCDGSVEWVQMLRVGDMVDQGVCVKHSGVKSGVTRLAC